jgi:hypothetical protein
VQREHRPEGGQVADKFKDLINKWVDDIRTSDK